MFRKTIIGATRCVLSGLVGLGLLALATAGCDESELVGLDSGFYDTGFYDSGFDNSGGYSSVIGVQADNLDTTLGNFIDYGGGVSWTYEP